MKKIMLFFTAFMALIMLAACGNTQSEGKPESKAKEQGAQAASEKTQEIEHLGKTYTVPARAERIIIVGAIEAMEDAKILDVKPVGASTTGGKFPEAFAKDVLKDATPIGEKTEPNVEAILKLKPDVILMSTKFPEETKQKIEKLAPVVPISHISEDWKDNLMVLAKLTGKEDVAKEKLQAYEHHLTTAKEELGANVKDKKILTLRIRRGDLFIYPEDVFMNAALYHDLGFPALEVTKAAKAQEQLPLEKISDIDPDYMFVQYETSSNQDKANALQDLEKNPVWKSLKAVKEDHVFVNAIDPILEGGPLYSREALLKATVEKLAE